MIETRFDASLDWQEQDGKAHSWRRRSFPFSADHRDGGGYYYVGRTEPRTVHRQTSEGWQSYTETPGWYSEWQPTSSDPSALIMSTRLREDTDLKVVQQAAVEHHAQSRRAHAWARYMRDNDPPEGP